MRLSGSKIRTKPVSAVAEYGRLPAYLDKRAVRDPPVILERSTRSRASRSTFDDPRRFCFKFGVGRRIPPPIWSRILITSLDAGIRWLMRDRRCDYFHSSSMNFILADLPCRQTWPPNNRVKVLTLNFWVAKR